LRDWPPLLALRQWIRDELERSRDSLASPRRDPESPGKTESKR